jgi:hypothetical protein
LDCDVFKFDVSEPSVLNRTELEDLIKQAGGRKEPAEAKVDAKL